MQYRSAFGHGFVGCIVLGDGTSHTSEARSVGPRLGRVWIVVFAVLDQWRCDVELKRYSAWALASMVSHTHKWT